MPKFDTKHPKREQILRFDSFHDGYNQEKSAPFISRNEISECKNLKYVISRSENQKKITLKKRPGTVRISNSAISSKVLACTYYINQSKYIIATATKLYYLNEFYKILYLF